MSRVITDYLDEIVCKFPNKIAFQDKNRNITFKELQIESYHIAQAIINEKINKEAIAIFLDKGVECIVGFLGVLYSGNYYTPIDTKMPISRIERILEVLKPSIVITDNKNITKVKEICGNVKIITIEEELKKNYKEEEIYKVVKKIIDTDILYVLFTSGSTGKPKGVIISQRSMMNYIDWAVETYKIDETFNFGSQSPFYFCMSVLEIFSTLKCGCTTFIIPQMYFTFPKKLLEYIKEKQINIIYWVPSALNIIVNMNGFEKYDISCLKWILFSGEVMPVKTLNMLRKTLPESKFVNVYGPTELTADVTYYIVNREFKETETLPIGIPCINSEIILLNEENKQVLDNSIGELCVRSSLLAYGYYGEEEKTNKVFVQNPLNKNYPEKIYRTGDLAYFNKYGELEFAGRKDFQIKHMGHRIELGEIEANVSSIDGIRENCCLYNLERKEIILFFSGKIEDKVLKDKLNELLPKYMIPNKRYLLKEMPHNVNGKIDRAKLKEKLEELNGRKNY